jgi:amidase
MASRRTRYGRGRDGLAVLVFMGAVAVALAAARTGASEPPSGWAPLDASILELQAAMESGRGSAAALVDFYQARIDALDGGAEGLNAIAAVNPEARTEAALLDAERQERGARGPLHGIPVVVKDNLHTRTMPTTAGSQLMAGFRTADDATLVQRLREAGAIVLAKANMHEWAVGITNVGSGFGYTRNPYDPGRNPGGSSGGAAVAVTANFAAVGLGTDTCGSLRIPAAHNNLVALRPTQGLLSRRGMVPLSSTQDIAGPLGRSVADVALVLEALVGVDPDDPQTAEGYGRPAERYTEGLNPLALNGARIGILEDLLLVEPADTAVAEVIGRAAAELQSLGATVERVALPEYWEIVEARLDGLFVLVYEFKRDIDRYLATTPGAPVDSLADLLASGMYHPDIEAALLASEAMGERSRGEYLEALLDRQRLRQRVLALMARERLDVLLYPSIRRVAARHGRAQPGSNCALSANTGLPALTLPAGLTAAGLPVGMELLGVPWSESRLLSLAFAYEQAVRPRVAPPLPEVDSPVVAVPGPAAPERHPDAAVGVEAATADPRR